MAGTGRRAARSSPGTGSNDTRHAVELTRARDGARASTAILSRHAVLQPARTARAHRATTARSPRRPTSRSCSTTSRRARRSTCPTTCSPSSRRSTASTASSRPTTTTSRRSTASSSTPATTTRSPATLDMGGAGGICVASHLVGDEMRADGRRAGASRRDRRRAARRYAALGSRPTRSHQGGARAARPRVGRPPAAARRGRRDERDGSAPCSSARACWSGTPSERPHAARPPPRRPGGDRQEHDGRRVRGPDRRRRLRAALPDRGHAGHRPRAAGLHATCASVPTTSRRSSSRTATRTTSGRCRSCCASSAPDIPGLRPPADDGDGALQARRAQAAARSSSATSSPASASRPGRSTSSSST